MTRSWCPRSPAPVTTTRWGSYRTAEYAHVIETTRAVLDRAIHGRAAARAGHA